MAISQNPEIMRYVYGDLNDYYSRPLSSDEVGVSSLDEKRAARQKHMATGQAAGSAAGAGAGLALTAATGGAAAPLIPVLSSVGGAGGGLAGSQWQDIQDNWKNKKLGTGLAAILGGATLGLPGLFLGASGADDISKKGKELVSRVNPFD